jgi:hypothetical protein
VHTLIAGRLRWHIFRGYGVCCSPGATQGSRWRSTRSTLRRRAPLPKSCVRIEMATELGPLQILKWSQWSLLMVHGVMVMVMVSFRSFFVRARSNNSDGAVGINQSPHGEIAHCDIGGGPDGQGMTKGRCIWCLATSHALVHDNWVRNCSSHSLDFDAYTSSSAAYNNLCEDGTEVLSESSLFGMFSLHCCISPTVVHLLLMYHH